MITMTPSKMSGVYKIEGVMDQYTNKSVPVAFLIHILSPMDILRVSADLDEQKILRFVPRYNKGEVTALDGLLKWFDEGFLNGSPISYKKVTVNGRQTEIIFVFIPYLSKRFLDPAMTEIIQQEILRRISLAYDMGARVFGLGAFTSVVTGGGKYIVDHHPLVKEGKIWISSGNSLTTAAANQSAFTACDFMGINPAVTTLTVVGATGSIGRVLCRMLCSSFAKINVMARNEDGLKKLQNELIRNSGKTANEVKIVTNKKEAIAESDLVVFVTNATCGLSEIGIEPADFKKGSVVIDVGRPKTISENIYTLRDDVLFIEGGVFHFDDTPEVLGMGKDTIFACALETIIKGLDGDACHSGIGIISPDEVIKYGTMAKKYGYKVTGFRMFDKPLDPVFLNQIKANAGR
ncbi:MAG: hypothetical protein ACD_58C00136G0003 [uncultured bacterium]|nr:MAG: hypothetical protein ACD_58C00136G0003 [uncultured bacterium]